MTIIAFKDGVMAADTAAWQGDIMVTTECQKIVRLRDGSLVGCAGEWGEIERFIAWLEAGRPDPKPEVACEDGFAALIVDLDGRVTEITGEMIEQGRTVEVGICIGASRRTVMGMMLAGLTAEEAVALAIERCAYIGGHVVTMRLDDIDEAPEGEAIVIADDWRTRRGLA